MQWPVLMSFAPGFMGVSKSKAQMGLSVSDLIRILILRIAADKALPFDANRAHAQPDSKAP
jgi:antitoxin component of RelBE/YafQ-DinJ toxin-antitoxin module